LNKIEKLQVELSYEISEKVWESDQRATILSRWRCDQSILECYCLGILSLVPKIPWERKILWY